MAICAVIDNVTNKLVNTIVAEVTDLPPENCRLLEIPEGMFWDESTADFIAPEPIPEVIEETITEEEPSPPPDTVV
jgi:hypothetical protein